MDLKMFSWLKGMTWYPKKEIVKWLCTGRVFEIWKICRWVLQDRLDKPQFKCDKRKLISQLGILSDVHKYQHFRIVSFESFFKNTWPSEWKINEFQMSYMESNYSARQCRTKLTAGNFVQQISCDNTSLKASIAVIFTV